MKKQILAVAAALVITFSTAFATEITPVPKAIVEEFNKEFNHVTGVQWKVTESFYKASFSIKDQKVDAFYGFDGKMIGLSRFISVNQLPLSLIKEAVKKSETASVSELFELLTEKGTEYFITYANEKGNTTYKSAGDSWVRYSSIL